MSHEFESGSALLSQHMNMLCSRRVRTFWVSMVSYARTEYLSGAILDEVIPKILIVVFGTKSPILQSAY